LNNHEKGGMNKIELPYQEKSHNKKESLPPYYNTRYQIWYRLLFSKEITTYPKRKGEITT
jgi:hypothetical protein